jgi:hypothetical protein
VVAAQAELEVTQPLANQAPVVLESHLQLMELQPEELVVVVEVAD